MKLKEFWDRNGDNIESFLLMGGLLFVVVFTTIIAMGAAVWFLEVIGIHGVFK